MTAPPEGRAEVRPAAAAVDRVVGWLTPDGRLGPHLLVLAACAGQAVTILWTWPLWQPRDLPPTLPLVIALDGIPFGAALLALVAVTAVRPRVGGPAFLAVLLLAVLADATRLQPEVVSLGVLMTVPTWGSTGRALARWHLATVWLWAGLQKLLADGWTDEAAPFIADLMGASGLADVVAVGLPVAEVAVGIAALWPRAWPVAAVGGAALHLGIAVTLSPLVGDANAAVVPWNVVLALAAVVLFGAAREALVPAPPVAAVAAVLVVTPALFHLGWMPAYLSHNLYSGGTAVARVCPADGPCAPAEPGAWGALAVPLPPDRAVYRRWFDRTCAAGSVLEVTGPRTLLAPASVTRHPCPRP